METSQGREMTLVLEGKVCKIASFSLTETMLYSENFMIKSVPATAPVAARIQSETVIHVLIYGAAAISAET